MITLTEDEITDLERRAGVVVRTLLWITARDSAGDPATLGLWSGTGPRTFTIGGASRSYAGPAFGRLPSMQAAVGLLVREYRLPASHLTPAALSLIATYSARFAPVEMHRAHFDASTRALIAEPRRIFRGWIDREPVSTGAVGGGGGLELTLSTSVRSLTRRVAAYCSDADQRERDPDDRFCEWVSGASLREVRWGQANAKPAGAVNGLIGGEFPTLPELR